MQSSRIWPSGNFSLQTMLWYIGNLAPSCRGPGGSPEGKGSVLVPVIASEQLFVSAGSVTPETGAPILSGLITVPSSGELSEETCLRGKRPLSGQIGRELRLALGTSTVETSTGPPCERRAGGFYPAGGTDGLCKSAAFLRSRGRWR